MDITKLKFNQLRPLIKADIQANIPPLLLGRAGIGKSSLLRSLARDFQTKVFSIQINQLGETSDLTGIRLEDYIDEETGKKRYKMSAFPHAIIDECIQYAKKHPNETPILFLDEFNRTTPAITSAILSFTTERRIGTMLFPNNVRFVLAGNDTGNINTIDEASTTRFALFKVTPDVETFINVQPNLNEHIKTILIERPDLLVTDVQLESNDAINHQNDDDDDDNRILLDDVLGFDNDGFNQITVPRTITAASTFLNQLGIDASASQNELDKLKEFTQIVTDENGSSNSLLYVALAAHTGTTEFTKLLHNHLQSHLQKMQSNNIKQVLQTENKDVEKLRPSQDVINTIAHAQSMEELNNLKASLSNEEKANLFVWLLVLKNIQEINNYNAIKPLMENLSKEIQQFSSEHIKALASLVAMKQSIDPNLVQLALNTNNQTIQSMSVFFNELL